MDLQDLVGEGGSAESVRLRLGSEPVPVVLEEPHRRQLWKLLRTSAVVLIMAAGASVIFETLVRPRQRSRIARVLCRAPEMENRTELSALPTPSVFSLTESEAIVSVLVSLETEHLCVWSRVSCCESEERRETGSPRGIADDRKLSS